MKTKHYLFFFLLCSITLATAQNSANTGPQEGLKELNKYWNYRARFLGEDGYGGFISIGLGQGQSIPASGRNINCDCQKDWHIVHSKAKTHKGNGVVKWGDATVHLGYYLAMLSMEYQNLKTANADTRENVRELYYALKAYERLDKQAEVSLGLEENLNGFFLRDDVPLDFYKNSIYDGMRRFSHLDRGGYDCVNSDFCKGTRAVDGGSYVSQDQVVALLFGFSFVKKFVGEVKYEKGNEETLGDLASLYSHLIVSYLEENKWRIKSPDGQKVSNRWGGDARAFSSLFASAAESITTGKYDYNYNKKTFLGRIAKCSFNWSFSLHTEINHAMIIKLMMISNQWSAEKMAKKTLKTDKVFYALADAVLNDRQMDSSIKKEDFQKVIESAPRFGPCFGTADCNAPDGWKSSQLWFHANHKNGNPYGVFFEYPGMDYMLLYNLYYYYYQSEMPRYKAPKKSSKNRKKVEAAGIALPDTN